MKKVLIVTLALILALNAGLLAVAQAETPEFPGGIQRFHGRQLVFRRL